MKRWLEVEGLIAPGKRARLTMANVNSVGEALLVACAGHGGTVYRPWVFDCDTGKVLYRWGYNDGHAQGIVALSGRHEMVA